MVSKAGGSAADGKRSAKVEEGEAVLPPWLAWKDTGAFSDICEPLLLTYSIHPN